MKKRWRVGVFLVLFTASAAAAAVEIPSYTVAQLQDQTFVREEIVRLTALKADLEREAAGTSPLFKTRVNGEIRKVDIAIGALSGIAEHGYSPDDAELKKLDGLQRRRVLGEKTVFSPPFWRIEGAGKKPSYLLGTIHIYEEHVMNVFWLVRTTLLDVDEVYTEIVLEERAEDFPPVYYLPQGQTLKSLVPPDLYEWVTEVYRSRGILPEQIERFKVWVVALLLDALPAPPGPGSEPAPALSRPDPLDWAIYKQAGKFGKRVGGLETIEEHAHVFDAMTPEEQVGWLRHRMNAREDDPTYAIDDLVGLIVIYLKGDDERLLRRIEDEYDPKSEFDQKLKKRMLSDRNHVMSARILAKLKDPAGRACLFAVGAAHLVGDDGLVNSLRGAGLRLTRVSTLEVDAPAEPVE
jgi:uncharacterized protein YbaP (TraB family)